MGKGGLLTGGPHGKVAGEVFVVPVVQVLADDLACHFGEDAAGVEADDLHLAGVCVHGDLLQKEGAGVLGQAIGGDDLGLGVQVVDARGGDVDDVLRRLSERNADGQG